MILTATDCWKHLVTLENVGRPEQSLHILGETDILWRSLILFPR